MHLQNLAIVIFVFAGALRENNVTFTLYAQPNRGLL